MHDIPFKYKLSNANRQPYKLRADFKYKGHDHTVYFGHVDYSDYTSHKDKERRRRYLARAAGIKDKQKRLTKDNPLSANYWSMRILWKY